MVFFFPLLKSNSHNSAKGSYFVLQALFCCQCVKNEFVVDMFYEIDVDKSENDIANLKINCTHLLFCCFPCPSEHILH